VVIAIVIKNNFPDNTRVVECKGNDSLLETNGFHQGGKVDTSSHKSGFVSANGINLHYLDWGGKDEVLLFLAGMGCNAHGFDDFAPHFTDKFHVMALTRRGHGESDHPETGYDIDTLTEDVRQFLDALGIERMILAGHSMAGLELSHFAALYPERVLKLIFLDAAYDRSSASYKNMVQKSPLRHIQAPGLDIDYYSEDDYFAAMKRAFPLLATVWTQAMEEQCRHEITQTAEGKIVEKMSEGINKALMDTLTSYTPEDSKIKAPTLSFYAISKGIWNISDEWMTEEQKAQVMDHFETTVNSNTRENIEQFRQNVPHAKIIEIPQGHHYCFIKHEELVYDEMRKFLLK
jgi:pimeloyl-ACP methyl ester carboxylesterase